MEPRYQFLANGAHAVVVENAAPEDEYIAQQTEGQVLRLRPGATAIEMDIIRLQVAPVFELVQQARLAQSGLAHHDRGMGDMLLDDGVIEVLQDAQFGITADHARLYAFHAAPPGAEGTRLAPQNAIDWHRLFKAFGLDWVERLNIENAADVLVGVVRDEHRTRPGRALQSGGQIHRQAGHGVLAFCAAADEDQAGVDADPHLETGQSSLRLQLGSDGVGLV